MFGIVSKRSIFNTFFLLLLLLPNLKIKCWFLNFIILLYSAFINTSAVCIFRLDDINNAFESPLMEEVDGFVYPIKNNPYPNISRLAA